LKEKDEHKKLHNNEEGSEDDCSDVVDSECTDHKKETVQNKIMFEMKSKLENLTSKINSLQLESKIKSS